MSKLKLTHRTACLVIVVCLILQTIDSLVFAQYDSPTSNSEQRVESLIRQMTLEEKVVLLAGLDEQTIVGIPRLGIPTLRASDGPQGVRSDGPATAMAGGIALAATWSPELAERVGVELGRDARARGVHFLLGPGVNIYRAPMNGRNYEYFGEDPFLASRIAVNYIKGVQSQNVSATIKHFIGNNSEFDRHSTDSIIDERTMREIYLPVFEAAVKEAHVGAVMDSYNLTNDKRMTENSYLNNDVLKQEWGFAGLIMSDWGATYDTVAAANAGMDLEMGTREFYTLEKLKAALEQGKLSMATIDEKVRRILRTAIRFGWLDRNQTDLNIPRYNLSGRETALQTARESMVLLKNEQALLPLNKHKIRSIAIIGPAAHPGVPVGGGSGQVTPFNSVSYLEGLSNYLDKGVQVYYNRGLPSLNEIAERTKFLTAEKEGEPGLRAEYFSNPDLQGAPAVTRVDEHISFGAVGGPFRPFPDKTLAARWSGYYFADDSGAYEISAALSEGTSGLYRLYVDDKLVIDNWATVKAAVSHTTIQLGSGAHKVVLERRARRARFGTRMQLGMVSQRSIVDSQAKKLASMCDVVVIAVGFDPSNNYEGEGADRSFSLPVGQDQLIKEISEVNKNAVVTIRSGGAVEMSWLPSVPAVVQSWYPGQEGGQALAEILFGDVNPSGRLPATFERRWEDNPVHDSYYPPPGSDQVVYKEGVFVGYRGYERNGAKPLFPFGFGLSYTTFKYSDLSVKPLSGTDSASAAPTPLYEVSFSITNTGSREGADVAQIYIGDSHSKIPRPPKELKGFAKVLLGPGETKRVSVRLNARSFSYYDVDTKQWRADPGKFDVLVGRSSEQIELRGLVNLASAIISK